MRQVPREPKQLQLKRERERVERCPGRRPACRHLLIEKLEEPRQSAECTRVRLLLGEEAEHRFEPDEPDVEPIRVLAGLVVRLDQIDTGDGLQLAGALMEEQLDMTQRLQPRPEARLGPADALRDRADAPAIERVEVEHAIRFAKPERSQDDGLRLVGSPGHVPASVGTAQAGNPAPASPFTSGMARVQMYTTAWCGYCVRAKALLDGKGIEYEEINLDEDPHFRQKLRELTGGWTVPQILVDGQPIGGYTELWRLDKSGRLDEQLTA